MRHLGLCVVTIISALGCSSAAEHGQEHVARTAQADSSGYTFMQFVAHEDDDTLFMNPDIQNFLGAGYGTVTVVLTAGEASGTVSVSSPGCTAPAPYEPQAVFAGNREEGMRSAYSSMAGLPNSWTRAVYSIAGTPVEIDALDGAAQVQLVFLNIPEEGDSDYAFAASCGGPLLCLYNDGAGALAFPTIVPNGGLAPAVAYTRASLMQTLSGLVSMYQPSVVRMLDPQPYEHYLAGDTYEVTYDNLDHRAAGRFADEALAAYTGNYAAQYYKGYSIQNHQPDLDPSEYVRKTDVFFNYMSSGDCQYDKNAIYFVCAQGLPMGYVGYWAWFRTTDERYPASTTWLTALSTGHLAAFAVQGRQVVAWIENTPGGSWTGPTLVGGGPVAPHIATAQLPNGDTAVFALQVPLPSPSNPALPPAQSIVYSVRSAATGQWSGWTSLGNPDDPSPGPWTGEPVVTVDGLGNMVVFARNSEGHISMRMQQDGSFGAWQAMPEPISGGPSGYDVLDGLAAVTAEDGTVHLFASTYQGWILHFTQSAPGLAFSPELFPSSNYVTTAAGPVTVTKNQDGRLEVFWHAATTTVDGAVTAGADVMTAWELVGGGWSDPWDMGNTGTGGYGPIAAMRRTSGEILLFARNGYDGVSANWQGAVNAGFVGWSDLQGQFPSYPAAATDANGNAVVTAVGVDGILYVKRETAGLGTFGDWHPSTWSPPVHLGGWRGSIGGFARR
jgi:hypothetical protein